MILNKNKCSEDNLFLLLIGFIATGIIFCYRNGISGNDFWWHIKAGEWMVAHKTVPAVDVFSWYARENGIEWISHEWLFDVVFYKIHIWGGNWAIFLFSMMSALLMAFLIIYRNRSQIKSNIVLSTIYLSPIIFIFPLYFYGRPHLISYFLLYALLFCLFKFRDDENTKSIYFVPVISILWGNFHGGSSNTPYILCFIFLVTGLFSLSIGKIEFEKLAKRQISTYLIVGILSFLGLAINPHGFDMLFYPYVNIADSFLQSFISEWASPDAKDFIDLLIFFFPMLFCCLTFVMTDKKIKAVDLFVFLFFAYLAFRSIRFCTIFYISSSFIVMRYFIPHKLKPMKTKADTVVLYLILIILLSANVYSISGVVKTAQKDDLISTALDMKYIDLIKKENPNRLYNDYNFGETLIYNDIDTFIDARADI